MALCEPFQFSSHDLPAGAPFDAHTYTPFGHTQYKLDILQFADEYDVVLWLDSDTIVVRMWAAVVLRRG